MCITNQNQMRRRSAPIGWETTNILLWATTAPFPRIVGSGWHIRLRKSSPAGISSAGHFWSICPQKRGDRRSAFQISLEFVIFANSDNAVGYDKSAARSPPAGIDRPGAERLRFRRQSRIVIANRYCRLPKVRGDVEVGFEIDLFDIRPIKQPPDHAKSTQLTKSAMGKRKSTASPNPTKASPPEPAETAKEADASRPAAKRRQDGFRETIESIVIAFVLAFLFRTFEAEAFVIPTGSMAETLYGRHKDVTCEKCNTLFRVSASDEVEESGIIAVDWSDGTHAEHRQLRPLPQLPLSQQRVGQSGIRRGPHLGQ